MLIIKKGSILITKEKLQGRSLIYDKSFDKGYALISCVNGLPKNSSTLVLERKGFCVTGYNFNWKKRITFVFEYKNKEKEFKEMIEKFGRYPFADQVLRVISSVQSNSCFKY